MKSLDAILALEEGAESPLEAAMAMQSLINGGTVWMLQGSYGRSAMAMIEDGQCMLGPSPARDYYGNFIPSRELVKAGTKGSYDFVVEHYGEDWAKALVAIEKEGVTCQ